MIESCGYLIILRDQAYAMALLSSLVQDDTVTMTVPIRVAPVRKVDICLMSFDKTHSDRIGLVHYGQKNARLDLQVKLDHVHDVSDVPLPIATVLAEAHIGSDLINLALPVSADDWVRIVEYISSRNPSISHIIAELERVIASLSRVRTSPAFETMSEGRDVVALTAEFAGFDRVDVLSRQPAEIENPQRYLTTMQGFRMLEARMLENDQNVFGDWENLRHYKCGIVVLRRRSQSGERKLMIMNTNMDSIEETLGVDLVYYNHAFASYVLVQYKRARKEGKRHVYYPRSDDAYEKEMTNMRAAIRATSADTRAHAAFVGPLNLFRLDPQAFYFKVCPATQYDPTTTTMIEGHYLPFAYWDNLMSRSKSYSIDSGNRYMNNTLFVELVQAGWIGSRDMSTAHLTAVIDGLVSEHREVMLAIDSG
jgi:hypothetical protein